MSRTNAQRIAQAFADVCSGKNYQCQLSKEADNLRLDISDFAERTIVKIYNTGTVQIQGRQNLLKTEMERLKAQYEENPQSFLGFEVPEVKACAQRYDIMLPGLRAQIRKSLDSLSGATVDISESPSPTAEYRARITRGELSLTIHQYSNGTLLLQGKTDALFDESCDLIEKACSPSDKEVISRFISSDEKSLEIFAAKYTPRLIELATSEVKCKLGDVYDYLEPHDQKWFVASECLCLTEIPLPEFSPLVMPASKAFEGFAKKLLSGVGLVEVDHFKIRSASFSPLNDKDNPRRKAVCAKEKYAETMLKKISVCLDMSRNFMMHSDESKVTKVNSLEEAREKVDAIFSDTRQIFDYFKDLYPLS